MTKKIKINSAITELHLYEEINEKVGWYLELTCNPQIAH